MSEPAPSSANSHCDDGALQGQHAATAPGGARACVRLCRSLQPPTPFSPRYRAATTTRPSSFDSHCKKFSQLQCEHRKTDKSGSLLTSLSHLQVSFSGVSDFFRLCGFLYVGLPGVGQTLRLPSHTGADRRRRRMQPPPLSQSQQLAQYDYSDSSRNGSRARNGARERLAPSTVRFAFRARAPVLCGELSLTRVPRVASDPAQGVGPGHRR